MGGDSFIPSPTGHRWVDSEHLKLGDQLKLKNNRIASVTGFLIRSEKTKVYNLRVLRLNNYTVNQLGVLVHNRAQKYDGGGKKSQDDLLNESTPGPRTKGKSTIRNKQGGFSEATNDFYALEPTQITDIGDGMTRGILKNGDIVILRPGSSNGLPTLEIQKGNKYLKFRYK